MKKAILVGLSLLALAACDKDSKREPSADVLHPRGSVVAILD